MSQTSFDTPLMQWLSAQQVAFRLLPHQTPAISIEDAAKQRGIRPSQMVKAILLRDMSERYALACCPGNQAIDPKKVRAHLGWRRMTCVSLDQVQAVTGYKIGTVTPLLLKRAMPILFDVALLAESEVTISSGDTMAGLALPLNELMTLCQPDVAAICRNVEETPS